MSVWELLKFVAAHHDCVNYRDLPRDEREDSVLIAITKNWVQYGTYPHFQSSLTLNNIRAYGDDPVFGLTVAITLRGKAALARHRLKVKKRKKHDQRAGAPRPKEPSKQAFAVYRYQLGTGKTQMELANDPALMRQLGRMVVQGTISRWLCQVKTWIKAGNVLSALPATSGNKPIPLDPERLDLGERQDGRAARQRNRPHSGND